MPETNNTVILPTQDRKNSKNKLILIVGLVVLGLLVAGAFYWKSNYASSKDGLKQYPYTYNKTDNYLLPGPSVGSGIRSVKPTEFAQPTSANSIADQATFVHNISKNQKTISLGSLAVASVVVQTPPTSDYLKTLDEAVMNPQSKNHAGLTQPVKNFLTDRLDPRYGVDLGTARHLTTDNIKSNAWTFDFTATDKSSNGKINPKIFKGQALLAVGKQTYYYFMIGAVDYNWNSNSKTWEQVLNSLKIDQ